MRKPKGYWQSVENCRKEALAIAEKEGWIEIPYTKELQKAGLSNIAMKNLGGRSGVAKLLGLPLKSDNSGNGAYQQNLERWDGKPSRAFDIEAEARKVGLSYADIQKRKTLELVGGVQI